MKVVIANFYTSVNLRWTPLESTYLNANFNLVSVFVHALFSSSVK